MDTSIISKILAANNIPKSTFSRRTGMHYAQLFTANSGKRPLTLNTLGKIAKRGFGCSIDALVFSCTDAPQELTCSEKEQFETVRAITRSKIIDIKKGDNAMQEDFDELDNVIDLNECAPLPSDAYVDYDAHDAGRTKRAAITAITSASRIDAGSIDLAIRLFKTGVASGLGERAAMLEAAQHICKSDRQNIYMQFAAEAL